ncbi:MAG: DNA methyltransferase [Polyangiaceae bacterium]|jgi:16S rRNA G966 N2-methylase RsmD
MGRLVLHAILRDVFPAFTAEEHERAVERVTLHGQREAIEVLDGQIVAGAAEYEACLAVGVKPALTTIERPECLTTYTVRRNMPRELGNLDRGVIAVLAYETIAKAQGRARMRVAGRIGGRRHGSKGRDAMARPFEGERWYASAARIVGVKPGCVRALAALRGSAPDVFDAVRDRRITVLRHAQQLARRVPCPKERAAILQKADATKLPLTALVYDQLREMRVARIPPGLPNGKRYVLYTGPLDQQGRRVRSESIDLVYADVPYGPDGQEMVEQIAILACRVLVPGGILALQPGHLRFAEAAALTSRHLACFAVGMLAYRGGGGGLLGRKLVQRLDCDPILFAYKGRQGQWPLKPVAHLRYEATEAEKDLFVWQKPLSAMTDLILSTIGRGAVVLDPVCGSGTTGEAALRLGGAFIGIDIDSERIRKIAAPRLAAVERELGMGLKQVS